MKNKLNSFLDKVNYGIIIGLIILLPVTFFINYFSLFHFGSTFQFKIHQVLTCILPIEVFIYGYKLLTKRHRLNKIDILVWLLILFGLISTIYALEPELAIWGSKYRHEGFIHICAYYFLFLNSRFIEKKDWIIKVINVLIIIGLLQFLYSFLQVFVRGRYIYVKYEIVAYRASGFVGHPNMLGSYIVLVLLLSLGMLFLYDKHKKFYLISSLLLYFNLILTQSTGPFYGFIFGFAFMSIYLIKKKKLDFKKLLITCSVLIMMLLSITAISNIWCSNKFYDEFKDEFTIVSDIKLTAMTIYQIITSSETINKAGVTSIESFGSNRIWLWSNSLKLVPKYWLHGTGIDNFAKPFKTVAESGIKYLSGANFDRAHNDYLQMLITEGVFALVSYIALLVVIFIEARKSKDKLVWVLLFGFIGYSIQAFANISVYNVAPFYFIVMGMLVGRIDKEKIVESKSE